MMGTDNRQHTIDDNHPWIIIIFDRIQFCCGHKEQKQLEFPNVACISVELVQVTRFCLHQLDDSVQMLVLPCNVQRHHLHSLLVSKCSHSCANDEKVALQKLFSTGFVHYHLSEHDPLYSRNIILQAKTRQREAYTLHANLFQKPLVIIT